MTLKGLFGKATHATEQRRWLQGRLGRLADDGVTWIYKPSYRQDRLWVRMGANGDQGIYAAAVNGDIPLRGNLPVLMRKDKGVLTIYETDTALLASDPAAPSGVPLHHHRSLAGTPLAPNPLSFVLESAQFDRGRVKSAGGMVVNIAPFSYLYGGVWATWAGGDIDLTAYKPATAGHHAWVMVGVDPATNAAVAVTGSSVVYATALAYADLDAIKNSVAWARNACAAIDVRDDDTAITDIADYIDAHGWFGQGADAAELDTWLATKDSDDLAEGATNLYMTTAEAAKLAGIEDGADVTDAVNIAATIHAATLDATPLDADEVPGLDSSASFALVRWTWTAIKAFLKTYFDTLYVVTATLTGYLLLAGRAGGQTAYGGTAAGDDLTLRGTAHATKGDVIIADDGGQVGVGTNAPQTLLDILKNQDAVTAITITNSSTASNARMRYQMSNGSAIVGIFQYVPFNNSFQIGPLTADATLNVGIFASGTADVIRFLTNNTEKVRITSAGNVGIGTAAPQGIFHVHDGTGGMLFVTKTGVTTSEVTLIANGTGDVVRGANINIFCRGSGGTIETSRTLTITTPGLGSTTSSVAGGAITLKLYSTGQLVVYASAGETWSIVAQILWL